jgi:predicted kinase
MIIDGTGADYQRIVKQVNELRELGYDTYMIFVNTSLDVAQERNRNRKRSLPPDIVEDSWRSVQNNIGRFQGLFGASNFVIVDNDDDGEDVFKKVWKYVMNFTKKKVKNPIAKKWMDMELAKKRRD